MKNLRAFYFTNGMIMVAEELSRDDREIKMRNALQISLQPDNRGGVQVGISAPFLPFVNDVKNQPKEVTIQRTALMSDFALDTTTHADMIQLHDQTFSSIILPTGGAGAMVSPFMKRT